MSGMAGDIVRARIQSFGEKAAMSGLMRDKPFKNRLFPIYSPHGFAACSPPQLLTFSIPTATQANWPMNSYLCLQRTSLPCLAGSLGNSAAGSAWAAINIILKLFRVSCGTFKERLLYVGQNSSNI